ARGAHPHRAHLGRGRDQRRGAQLPAGGELSRRSQLDRERPAGATGPLPRGRDERGHPERRDVGAPEERARGEDERAEHEWCGELREGPPPGGAAVPRRAGGAHRARAAWRVLAGPGTEPSSAVTTLCACVPPAHAAAVRVSRCASAGTATALTSSGVTKSRPSRTASARPTSSRACEPRGEAPTSTAWWARVAPARATQ